MTRTFSLISWLVFLVLGTVTPCLADGRVRPLEVGNGFAVWFQDIDGTPTLRLRGTDQPPATNSSNLGGAFIDNFRSFNRLDFDLDGNFTLFALGSFMDRNGRRINDAQLRLQIRTVRPGLRHVTITNSSSFQSARYTVQGADRRDPLLIVGNGRIRSLRVDGGLASISTETVTSVPSIPGAFQRFVKLEPIVVK